MSVSNKNLHRGASNNVIIGVNDSVERSSYKKVERAAEYDPEGGNSVEDENKREATNEDEEDDDESQANNRELFSGLLGNGEEDAL